MRLPEVKDLALHTELLWGRAQRLPLKGLHRPGALGEALREVDSGLPFSVSSFPPEAPSHG